MDVLFAAARECLADREIIKQKNSHNTSEYVNECNSGSFHDLDVFIENHKEKIIKLMAQKYSITTTTCDFQYTCR